VSGAPFRERGIDSGVHDLVVHLASEDALDRDTTSQ
jgi:hypothetical protein